MPTLRAIRESLVDVSRRYSRVAHEAEDLAHDVILSALRRGAPLDGDAFLRGIHGAARRHGAFLARSAGRRRAREACAASSDVEDGDAGAGGDLVEGAPLSVLPPALRTTLLLLLSGLEKAELRVALGVSDAALRKRFQALREHGPLARPELAGRTTTPARLQLRRSQVGLLSRLAGAFGGGQARRALATSDPDGHGLIFAEVLTPGPGAATPEASAANERTPAKGTSC